MKKKGKNLLPPAKIDVEKRGERGKRCDEEYHIHDTFSWAGVAMATGVARVTVGNCF